MIVQRFSENPYQYEGFEIWVVKNMTEFFNGNGVIQEIFEKEYKIPISEFENRRAELPETSLGLMTHILDQIGDKHFVVFTLNDENHQAFIAMQESKIMDFGVAIQDLEPDQVYILIMDKVKEVKMGL